MTKKNLLLVTFFALSLFLFIAGKVIWPYLGWLIDLEMVSYCLIAITGIVIIAELIFFFKSDYMGSLYVLPFCVSFVATTIIYSDKYADCSAEGECIYDSYPGILYSNTGKLINDGSYDYQGESRGDSGCPYFAKSGISNAYGGPYFWFIESVKNELNSYRSDDDYKEYTLYISFTIYDKSGNIMDSYETDIDYKYNESESLHKYNYETYKYHSNFEDEIESDLREKINNYIKDLVKSGVWLILQDKFE